MVASLHNGRALAVLGRHDEARGLYAAAVESTEEYLGEDHPYYLAAVAAFQDSKGATAFTPGRPRREIHLDVPLI
jgi:hypothetical protein